MPPPEARFRIGSCDVLALGTIPGFVPDAARVEAAFRGHRPDVVALGVPEEDLAALRFLAASEAPHELIGPHQEPPPEGRRRLTDPGMGAAGIDALMAPRTGSLPAEEVPESAVAGLDARSVRLLELLRRFGPTRLPSPDLEAAHRLAAALGVRLEAVDLGDAEHAEAYTRLVGVRHLVGARGRERRLLAATFPEAADAYALAVAWDAQERDLRPIAALEALREGHMASRLRGLAARAGRLLAVLPAARFAGVVRAAQKA